MVDNIFFTLARCFSPASILAGGRLAGWTGCKKHQPWRKMKKQWETISSCSPEFKHYLGKGVYQSTTIYYTSISCVACDMMPPQYVVTCAGDSIKINNWNDVEDTRIIATCRNL